MRQNHNRSSDHHSSSSTCSNANTNSCREEEFTALSREAFGVIVQVRSIFETQLWCKGQIFHISTLHTIAGSLTLLVTDTIRSNASLKPGTCDYVLDLKVITLNASLSNNQVIKHQ